MLDSRSVPLDGKSNLLLRYRGAKRTFPYVSAADVLSGQTPAGRPSRTRSSSSARPRSARARSWRRRSTRCLRASRCRPRWPTTCCSRTSSAGPSTARWSRRRSCSALGIVAALLVGAARPRLGRRRRARSAIAALWGGAVWLMSTRGTFLSPRLSDARPDVGARATMAVAQLRARAPPRRSGRSGQESTSQRLMVQALLSLTEVRDAETGRHSRRTQRYARVLARAARHPRRLPRLSDAANASICWRAWRRCTTSARSACPISC